MELTPIKSKAMQEDPTLCVNLRCRRIRSHNELGLCWYHEEILNQQHRQRTKHFKVRSGWEE